MKYDNIITSEELERIERYLTNEMDGAESASFALEMSNDAALRKKVDEVRMLMLGIKEASLEEHLRGNKPEMRVIPPGETGKFRRMKGKRWLVAASVIVLAGVFAWFFLIGRNENKELYSQYYSPDPGLPTVMGVSTNYDFQKAMVEYKNEEYDKALQSWLKLEEENPGSDTLSYFIGVAGQANSDHDLAIRKLTVVASDTSSAFHKDASWYLGLEFLRRGEKEKAKEYIARSGYPRAPELLQAINKK